MTKAELEAEQAKRLPPDNQPLEWDEAEKQLAEILQQHQAKRQELHGSPAQNKALTSPKSSTL